MGTPLLIRYKFDATGKSPDNFVSNEPQSLVPRTIRATVPNHGLYYANSMVVVDAANNQPLTPGVDWQPAELDEEITERTGIAAFAVVIITNPSVSPQVLLTYQAVGGPNSTTIGAIQSMLDKMQTDSRPVDWANVLNKPTQFSPAKHLHDIGDTYGWEYIVQAVNRIRMALELKELGEHQVWLNDVKKQIADLTAAITSITATANAHFMDYNNPHNVTADQIDAYRKAYIDAALAQIQTNLDAHAARTDNPHQLKASDVGAYSTTQIDQISASITAGLQALLQQHLQDLNNPHQTTAASINAYTRAEIDAIVANALTSVNAHVQRIDNPHQVNATQVGLGNVANYPVATALQADDPSNTTSYMTPALTKQVFDTKMATYPLDSRYAKKTDLPVNPLSYVNGKVMFNTGSGSIQVWPPQWQA